MEELSIKRSSIGSASGSIDVFGGFAKAAGSLALRALSEPRVTVLLTEITDDSLRLSSTRHGRFSAAILPLRELLLANKDTPDLKDWLLAEDAPLWTYHVVGSLYLFCKSRNWIPQEGLSFAIASDLPGNRGLSSSVALKVACIRALEKLSASYLRQDEFSRICQEIDQALLGVAHDPSALIASTQNKPGSLLPINPCQAVSLNAIELPRGVTFFSWTQQLSVPRDASRYHAYAFAAAMGRRIALASFDGETCEALPRPSIYLSRDADAVPETLSCEEFEQTYGAFETPYALPDPLQEYQPNAAFGFSMRENRRCELAIHILQSMASINKRKAIEHIGEMLWESHFDCRQLGLRLEEAESMVKELIEAGPQNGVYGGRLSYQGEDCTIIILAEKNAIAFLRRLARAHIPTTDQPLRII